MDPKGEKVMIKDRVGPAILRLRKLQLTIYIQGFHGTDGWFGFDIDGTWCTRRREGTVTY